MDSEHFEPSNSPAQEQNVNLRHYWHVILERRWLVITAFVSVFVLSLIYLFRATPIYEAQTRIQINREGGDVLSVGDIAIDRGDQDYLQTQYKNLLSRTLIESVITQLKLDKDERYREALDRAAAVAEDITIAPVRLSRLVDIKVEHPSPKQAATIANTLVDNFIKNHLDQKMAASLEILTRLKAEANAQKKEMEEAEQALAKYRTDHDVLTFENSESLILQSLKQYQADLDRARTEAAAAEQTIREIDAMLEAKVDIFTIPQIRDSVEIQSLRRDLAVLDSEFAELKKRYKHKHPVYIQMEEKIGSLHASLMGQANSIIASLRNKALLAKATELQLRQIVAEQEKKQEDLRFLQIGYEVLKRDAEQSTLLYNTILARVKEMDLLTRNAMNNIHVIDEARETFNPVKPRVVLTLFLGAFGGLAVAIGLAFFVNYLDDSIKSQDDVESYLRLPFLGYVPNIKTNSVVERDLQAHLHPQSNAAEGFRTIRATISLSHKAERTGVLAVTSTIPSEGKSLIASNLAIVTAQTGLRTLLVDADLRRPSVHKAYQLHSPVGLSSYLMDEVDKLDPMVHKTEVPNLDVICCGAVPSTPSELVSSKRMLDFIEAARARYDRVILDCPPISAVSDPLIISALSDGVVFVTKFNKIRREHARKSVQRVQNAGIHLVGVVINDIDFEGKDSYYYSYYYYQNRYYSSHYKNQAVPGVAAKGGRSKPQEAKAPAGGNGAGTLNS